jgi:hypothetical protein
MTVDDPLNERLRRLDRDALQVFERFDWTAVVSSLS